jgi:hypothetical protein
MEEIKGMLKTQGELAISYMEQRKKIKLEKNRAEKARAKVKQLLK